MWIAWGWALMWHCLPVYVRHGLSPWCLDNESKLLWILRYPAGGLNTVAGPLKVSIHSGLCGLHGLSSIIHIEYELWYVIVLYCKRWCAYWFWSWLSQRICDILDMWIVYLMIDMICYMLHVILLLSLGSQILWCACILKRMLTAMSTESWERGIYIRSSGSQAVSFKNSASWNGQ